MDEKLRAEVDADFAAFRKMLPELLRPIYLLHLNP